MSELSTCALCPRLCRPSCPVASGSHREAATPTAIAAGLLEWERGRWTDAMALQAATLCTDCGACQDHCHLHRPLPEILRRTRAQLSTPPQLDPLRAIEGSGDLVAIEVDDRPLAAALSRKLARPVRRWRTNDRLGIAVIDHTEVWQRQAERIRRVVGDLSVVVTDGGVAHALDAAGVSYQWLHQLLPALMWSQGSCRAGGGRPLACCGGAGPLRSFHPDDAARVAETWLERSADGNAADSRCREHLRSCGAEVEDVLDALLTELGMA